MPTSLTNTHDSQNPIPNPPPFHPLTGLDSFRDLKELAEHPQGARKLGHISSSFHLSSVDGCFRKKGALILPHFEPSIVGWNIGRASHHLPRNELILSLVLISYILLPRILPNKLLWTLCGMRWSTNRKVLNNNLQLLLCLFLSAHIT